MQTKTSFGLRVCVLTLFALTIICSQALAAEFTANMTEQQGEWSKSGKIYVKGSKYCMEMVEGGEQIVVIVDQTAKKTFVMPVSMKEYRELDIDDMTSVMNDPFQGYKYTAEMGEEKNVGTETVNGFECDKFVISMMETDVMTKWVSKKLNFPIKIVAHGQPDRVTELTNIKEESVDDAKFQIPDGFKKWIDPETLPVEPPEWAKGISSAPVMNPPFDHDMSAGDIIRIKVEPGKSLAIKGISKTDTEATAKVIPFKDGRPLKKDSWYNNFAQKGTICARQHETSVEADEFVVYVYEGDITATAKWQEMHEKTVTEGDEMSLALKGWDNIQTRLVNIGDSESVAIINYFSNGAPVSEEEIGPVKWRTITLKESNEVDNRAISPKGDEVVFKVEKGKMLIKLGQFDSFEF